ncbi:hypothetical protein NliqN6_5251 [Naganishia liquefaciens]|uniref:Amidohydrolase 3 domain-containing protein n=1 Tax=Naganishia liquefaciens TaxID=104408 RepID=A0A8H3TZ48_9TREE|nr:hypothetical protein NliqN6_5251 [Naganishia liquefaciens]
MASVGWYFCAFDKYITRIMRQVTTGGQEWRHHTHNLPEFYSLCSRDAHGIYTSEAGNEWVQCVTVQNGVIVDVGDLAHVTSEQYYLNGKHSEVVPRSTPGEFLHQVDIRSIKPRIIHLPTGSFMSPGLVDSHAHSLQYGWSRQLPLRGSVSVDDVIAKVNAYAKSHQKQIAEGQWIEGAGWDQNIWPVKSFPNATDFDRSKALRDLPIALKRIDIHAEWVSPKVLEMMGDLPEEVPGGQIMRDADGKPTGVFLDDAMFLIDKVRPRWSETQMQEYLNITIEDALSKGLVAIHDGGVVPEQVEFFQRAGKAGHLPIRFYIMRACPDKEKYCGDEYPMMIGDANNHLNVKSVKLFADGALGSWGAALLEPYSDKPEEYGTMRSPEKVWEPLIKDFVRNGWQVNVHCIGDRANHIVLNAMERALMELPEHERGGRRLRIEHAQIMKLEDLERAAKLGIIASYQPTHATSDMWYAEDRLGPERIKGAYAWRRYLQAGGRITLGSDFPVESIDPLKGFYAAVTRLDEEGNSPMGKDGWYPEQKLSREEALRGMTIDAAYASFLENKTGSFSVGKQFDAVVWSQSLISTPQDTILDTRVLSTIIDGKAVWGKLFQSAQSNPQAFRRDPSRVWSYSVAHSPEGSAG